VQVRTLAKRNGVDDHAFRRRFMADAPVVVDVVPPGRICLSDGNSTERR
jgi:hypothetical protein